jgi:Undecaprenyl-phosphate galactose phosphotransferase WbaP
MSAKTMISAATLAPSPGLAAVTASTAAGPPIASLCLLLSDFVGVSILFWLAVWIGYTFYPDLDVRRYLEIFPASLIFLAVFYAQGLYPGMLLHPAEEMRRVFHSVTVVFLALLFTVFLRKSGAEYSRRIFLVIWALGTPAVLSGRAIVRKFLGQKSWWQVPVIVLGSNAAVQEVARSLKESGRGLRVTGVLLENPVTAWDDGLSPILGSLSDAPLVNARGCARYAILAMPNRPHEELRQIIQDYCKSFHRILLVTDLPGVCCLGISAREIGGQVGLEIPQRLCFVAPKVIKRCLDIVVSAALLVMLVPLLLLIAISIKLTSEGGIFFGHLRYGRDGKIFRALKFRTMVTDADRILEEHLQRHPEHMLEWQRDHKLKRDPRMTRVGGWLRRYSLDELPQLVNILLGHMSLVGPRPIVHSEIARYANSYGLYTRVPPGLTGLWQVSGRNNTTYKERVAFDEYYIRNWSVWMDMYILARTFQAVLHADGAY